MWKEEGGRMRAKGNCSTLGSNLKSSAVLQTQVYLNVCCCFV